MNFVVYGIMDEAVPRIFGGVQGRVHYKSIIFDMILVNTFVRASVHVNEFRRDKS